MIRINRPFTGDEELREIQSVLESGYLTQGAKVAAFENDVIARTGSKHGFAMTSATTALHLSLLVAGIKRGDEVLVSDFTFPATGNVIVEAGAIPVCVDVHPDTYAMDAADLEKRITPRARAILVVHPFGLAADMDAIMDVASRHGLIVIEDAACALGSRYRDRWCGSMGAIGCFSFHPRKSITTGEGGMIVTDDDSIAERIALLRSHGGERREWYSEFVDFGFNYRMSDVLAGLGVAQLRRLDWLVEGKRKHAATLDNLLRDIPGVTIPVEPKDCFHTYQSYVVVLDDGIDRDSVIGALRKKGVESTLGTYAMHAQPSFSKAFSLEPGELPVSYKLYCQSLTLPLYPQLTDSEVNQVAEAVQECVKSLS